MKFPSLRKILFAGLILASIGWLGLWLILSQTFPTLGPRWLFFFLLTLALSGSAMPIIGFFHRRFPTNPPATSETVVRQSIWVGVYGNLLAWLQLGRVLNLALVVFMAVAFLVIEFFLSWRERSQFDPETEIHE
jgi:hypothetical protein